MGLRRFPCGGAVTTSEDGEQQYRITRAISADKRKAVFILAHPFAIRGEKPGIEESRCVKFCELHGYGEMCIVYLFPYCVTEVAELNGRIAPWGPGPVNRRIQDIEVNFTSGGIAIAAWGDDGMYRDGGTDFLARFDGTPQCFSWQRSPITPIYTLGLTPVGNPVSIIDAAPGAAPRLHPRFEKAAA
jgi:hypothetical protein